MIPPDAPITGPTGAKATLDDYRWHIEQDIGRKAIVELHDYIYGVHSHPSLYSNSERDAVSSFLTPTLNTIAPAVNHASGTSVDKPIRDAILLASVLAEKHQDAERDEQGLAHPFPDTAYFTSDAVTRATSGARQNMEYMAEILHKVNAALPPSVAPATATPTFKAEPDPAVPHDKLATYHDHKRYVVKTLGRESLMNLHDWASGVRKNPTLYSDSEHAVLTDELLPLFAAVSPLVNEATTEISHEDEKKVASIITLSEILEWTPLDVHGVPHPFQHSSVVTYPDYTRLYPVVSENLTNYAQANFSRWYDVPASVEPHPAGARENKVERSAER